MVDIMYFLFFMIGIVLGSFLNVCIYRIPRGESIVAPPSRCPACGTRLRALDLLPVLSWLWLRGRCRYCGAGVPAKYPLVELLSGMIYVGLYHNFGLQPVLAGGLILASILIVVTFTDLEHYRIPNKVVLFGFLAGLGYVIWSKEPPLINAFFGVLAGGGPLYLLALLTSGMGGGDVKLAAMAGLYLGWQKVILALFLAAGLASLVGMTLIALGIKKRKDPIPFGPFIALGTMISLLWGKQLIEWYLTMLY
ncbi:hypothetical protein SY88_11455 [Clostridiales bacterium PH28_bin88]|nr:hypothetical protein SY88_11455 [Clostridiales bacterium PH28_bin88]